MIPLRSHFILASDEHVLAIGLVYYDVTPKHSIIKTTPRIMLRPEVTRVTTHQINYMYRKSLQ